MNKFTLLIMASLLSWSCITSHTATDDVGSANIAQSTIDRTIKTLTTRHGQEQLNQISRGVNHTASLWRAADGTQSEFEEFCTENFIADENEKSFFFNKVSRSMEILYGNYNRITIDLQRPIHEPMGNITPIDEAFAAFSPAAHLDDDLYQSKVAFLITLNFPYFSLAEKKQLSPQWSRRDWAYARLGDMFVSRVPASVIQDIAKAESDAEMYIAGYNIYAGKLVDDNQHSLFPDDMVLLSHWNIRDEIKSNYSRGDTGLLKQDMLYKVMTRIVNQSIPADVINNPNLNWNPYSNKVTNKDGETTSEPENNVRYQHILNCFNAMSMEDQFSPLSTAIDRAFEGEMEISQSDAEALFISFLSSPAIKEVGTLIEKRLGRTLKPWDIWYDGFKPRAGINEDELDKTTRKLYPNAAALKADLPNMLRKLGFSNDRSVYIADKIEVDAARGSGHAWGAAMKGDVAHLRTRIGGNGLDYKGYNIAVHEFGHNVEQTISLYDVDYYMLQGVPNTAFTEALAFLFQKRDLDLLGMKNNDPKKEAFDVLDNFWSVYEIMGVSLVDQYMWKWMYANPNATAAELKDAVNAIAKDVWNKYYAPVFGVEDQTVLAVYSHMVNSPIYLSNYSFGHLIQFQVEQYLKNSHFATEVERIFALGKLTPTEWMKKGVGQVISTETIINEALKAAKLITQ